MLRYLKIYQQFLNKSLAAELQYRSNFFLLILVTFAWGLVYIFLYVFIFSHLQQVGDWTYERSLILAATFLLINALNKFLFRENLKRIALLVYQGELDFILLKPLSSQFYVSLRKFFLRPFLRFFLGWMVLLVVIIQTQTKITFFSFFSYLFFLIISTVIVYSLWFMTCCSVFWLGNLENIYNFFHPVLRITALPFDILPKFLKEIFFFIIPLVFIATIPAKSLFALVSWPTAFYGLFIAWFLLFLSHKLWNLGLKHYSSASS